MTDFESKEAWENLLIFLEGCGARLRRYEEEAAESLELYKNEERCRALHREKTAFLISLPDIVGELLEPVAPELRKEAERGLNQFAFDAKRAQEKNSVFYMSVLLFPDDENRKEPKAFDEFIEHLKKKVEGTEGNRSEA